MPELSEEEIHKLKNNKLSDEEIRLRLVEMIFGHSIKYNGSYNVTVRLKLAEIFFDYVKLGNRVKVENGKELKDVQ